MKKLFTLFLAALMLVSCLTACGSDASGALKVIDVPLTVEEYAYGVKKGDAELLGQINAYLESIKADGTFDAIVNKYFGDGTPTAVVSAKEMKTDGSQLIVATNAAFAPFEYMEGENYYGVDMEIMDGFAKYLGRELYIYNMEFEAVCLAVGGDENTASYCDIAAAGLTVNDERKETLDFSASYYNASQMLVVKEDDTTFDGLTAEQITEKLNGMNDATKIGVQTGTTGQLFCEGDADWGFAGFPVTTVGYSNGALACQNILNGNVNYVVIDEGPAKNIVKAINEAN